MVSPYLERPVRTIDEACADLARAIVKAGSHGDAREAERLARELGQLRVEQAAAARERGEPPAWLQDFAWDGPASGWVRTAEKRRFERQGGESAVTCPSTSCSGSSAPSPPRPPSSPSSPASSSSSSR